MRMFWHVVILLLLFFLASVALSSLLEFKGIDISPKIIVLPIKGAIGFERGDGFFAKGFSVNAALKKLDEINKDGSVKGVILEIDSPGGAVVASKQLAAKVKSMDKPVVALVKESAASGAYWVASSSDWIVSDELSVIGSIGVIGSYLQFSDLMKEYGVDYERLVAGDMKDLGSPFKELTSEERKLLQTRLDEIHAYFMNDVALSRKISIESIKEISDGSFYLGREAKELGLVDEFGNMEIAFNATKRLADVKDARLVFVEQKPTFAEAISEFTSKSSYLLGRGVGDGLKISGRQELLSV